MWTPQASTLETTAPPSAIVRSPCRAICPSTWPSTRRLPLPVILPRTRVPPPIVASRAALAVCLRHWGLA